MGGSNSAMAYGHLLHHKDTMGPEDFEGQLRAHDVLAGAAIRAGLHP